MRRHHDPIEVRLGPAFEARRSQVERSRRDSTRAVSAQVDQARAVSAQLDQARAVSAQVDQARAVSAQVDQELDGQTPDDQGPAQFVWRGRVWRVLRVESRWIESGSWWTGPAVRAARGEMDPVRRDPDRMGRRESDQKLGTPGLEVADDLLCEVEVWRVEAANGRAGSRGVYDLAHALSAGDWQLRTVVD